MERGSFPGHGVVQSERLDLVLLNAPVMDALIAGRKVQAQAFIGFSLPASFPEKHDLEFLRFRRAQLESTPDWAPWLVRAVVRRNDNLLVGTITFHGPPGINGLQAAGAVEVGYTIRAESRDRGYATEAARAMMRWATDQHNVTHFVSSIEPDNEPSLRVIRKLGFKPTGIVDDGELIFDFHRSST
jgi:[ribosomal protein S5]-alanine N-acetyltransferase